MARVLVVDAANVVGSKPDGWWRDRAGAAGRLLTALAASEDAHDGVILVLEGQAKAAAPVGEQDGVVIVHAWAEGDDEIVVQARAFVEAGHDTDVATNDRELRRRVSDVGARPISVGELRRAIGY